MSSLRLVHGLNLWVAFFNFKIRSFFYEASFCFFFWFWSSFRCDCRENALLQHYSASYARWFSALMACFHPLPAWRSREDKKSIVFSSEKGIPSTFMQLPCGSCVGCRTDRARSWALRCEHEASLYEHNLFLTLTYDDYHLPDFGSLYPRHVTLFIKRLRRRFGSGIRYFYCGEYGARFSRPHYHMCLFNLCLPREGLKPISVGSAGDTLYYSLDLLDLWPYGFHTIGQLTFSSAAYTALYCLKKIPYQDYPLNVTEPFIRMSRRPGLGRGWFDKYAKTDIYSYYDALVNYNGRRVRPPKYYDNCYKQQYPDEFNLIAIARRESIDTAERTPERLKIKEHLLLHKLTRSRRLYHADIERGISPLPLFDVLRPRNYFENLPC